MESLGLLIGHLLGDFIFQNDWMAANKSNQHPGKQPGEPIHGNGFVIATEASIVDCAAWWFAYAKWKKGNVACFVHCICYTLAVWACSFWWMPWWGLVACFACHLPIDRWHLAGWWMRNVSGQASFASGPLSPWSIIIVDNTFHLATLFAIGVLSNI